MKGDFNMNAKNYKVEELKIYRMKKVPIFKPNPRYRDGLTIFEIEREMSLEEKIAFIDEMRDGIASYLLDILKKWEDVVITPGVITLNILDKEKDTLPKDQFENPKIVSKKAWIKERDKREIIDIEHQIGSYSLFSNRFSDMSTICPTTDYGFSQEYTGEHIAHQWFHDLCCELYAEEKKYFKEHDPFQQKLTKVRNYGQKYSLCFDDKELNDVLWNNKEDVSEERLDKYILAFEELERTIHRITKWIL